MFYAGHSLLLTRTSVVSVNTIQWIGSFSQNNSDPKKDDDALKMNCFKRNDA